MQTKSPEKRYDSTEIEKVFSPVLVVNNSKLKPFIELFEIYPENINLQPLGTVTGFFKINEQSDDSAYIVNFLSSVIKKEYYANPKRSVSESFDAALHKLNLALAEIAKNGNVRWIGQLDAAICVLEKNILHFTVCGTGQIILIRNQNMSDISKDLNPEELEPNPLKTFSNVSSGYLEKQDKLIITSPDIFNIFSFNELKKSSLRFDQDKFVQFLKTAMKNELESGATIVIDINESVPAEEPKKKKSRSSEKPINPFSGKTFENPIVSEKNLSPIKDENDSEYTDERTGHIYVQGNTETPKEGSFWESAWEMTAEKTMDFLHWIKKRILRLKGESLKLFRWSGKKTVAFLGWLWEKIKESRTKKQSPHPKAVESDLQVTSSLEEISEPMIGSDPVQEVHQTNSEPQGSFFRDLWSGLSFRELWGKISGFLPSFSRIGETFQKLSYPQRRYALAILVLIVVSPWIISRIKQEPEPPAENPPVEEVVKRNPVLDDKNVREIDRLTVLKTLDGTKKALVLNEKLFAVTKDRIISFENIQEPAEYPLPSGSGSISFALAMDDLNLIFLISDDRKITSFSPIAKQFKENSISLPEGIAIKSAGTYLTYLYLADSKSNQIYRFPRAESGFGEKTDWLKDSLDLSGAKDMAIEENIFIATGNNIIKLFQGKKQDFNLEKTSVGLEIKKIYTGPDLSNLYVLDSQNSRVLRYSKNGEFLNQFYSPEINQASEISVDEKSNRIYLVTSAGISFLEM